MKATRFYGIVFLIMGMAACSYDGDGPIPDNRPPNTFNLLLVAKVSVDCTAGSQFYLGGRHTLDVRL